VVLETELLGFYFFPVVALTLVLTLRRSWALFWTGAGTSVVCLALGNQKVHHIASWWPATMASTLAMVGLAWLAWRDQAREPSRTTTAARRGVLAPTHSHVRLIGGGTETERERKAGATVA